MKNKKFMKETPVIETKKADTLTVGDVVNALVQFPADAALTFIDGGVSIDDSNHRVSNETLQKISKSDKVASVEISDEPFFNYPEEEYVDDVCDKSLEDAIMDNHLFGPAHNDIDLLNHFRVVDAEKLYEVPLMIPNKQQLDYEANHLHPYQNLQLNEMRAHNAYIAECAGELRRREVAGILEYVTQCIAHFGIKSNRSMCEIVDAMHEEF